MNKRRREIIASLQLAMNSAPSLFGADALPRKDVPGLAMRARVNADAAAEVLIYGPIVQGSYGDGISAADVAAVIRDAGSGPINVRINSPGGDVFQGVAIHTMLARHPGFIHTFNDGLAASAASVILMAGDKITTAEHAMTMVHDGMTGPYGNAKTIRRAADLLDKVSESIAAIYADRAGEDIEHWRGLMTQNEEDGTWFTGTEAYAAGLVDSLTEAPDEDEDTLVWDRLANWTDRLPAALAEQVTAHLKPAPERERTVISLKVPTPAEDAPDAPELATGGVVQGGPLPIGEDGCAFVVPDKDFAHAMSMWAWMNQSGHAARNGVASE